MLGKKSDTNVQASRGPELKLGLLLGRQSSKKLSHACIHQLSSSLVLVIAFSNGKNNIVLVFRSKICLLQYLFLSLVTVMHSSHIPQRGTLLIISTSLTVEQKTSIRFCRLLHSCTKIYVDPSHFFCYSANMLIVSQLNDSVISPKMVCLMLAFLI